MSDNEQKPPREPASKLSPADEAQNLKLQELAMKGEGFLYGKRDDQSDDLETR